MPINTSGPVSLGGGTSGVSIAFEVGVGATTQISLNDTNVRTLAGVPSGQITMPTNFYGKSNAFTFNRTISSNTQNYNLLNDMVANGYTNGSAFVANITIASGIYVWSDSTSLAAFDSGNITGTGTINITNNGFIIGKGGDGSQQSAHNTSAAGPVLNTLNPGGNAINTVRSMSITNNSFIAGGGGGGASYLISENNPGGLQSFSPCGGGGGAGGGKGGNTIYYQNGGVIARSSVGGAGGGLGSTGANGPNPQYSLAVTSPGANSDLGGAGGGRILPGVGGEGRAFSGVYSAGGGGSAGNAGTRAIFTAPGPSLTSGAISALGGGAGGSGSAFRTVQKLGSAQFGSGGGGGWGAAGGGAYARGTTASVAVGGLGGKAINTNGNSITFVTPGTVYGAVN